MDSDKDQAVDKQEADADFDPNKPNENEERQSEDEGQIEDTFHDAEMDEESDQEVNVERQLNFNAEISMLINYDVISRYMSVVDQRNQLSKQADLVQMTASFFRRVHFQLKQTWIFFQMDYMNCFNDFLQKNQCTNSLMKGIMGMDGGSGSFVERKLQVSQD